MKSHFLFPIILSLIFIVSDISLASEVKTDLDVQEYIRGTTKTYSFIVGQSLSRSLKNFGLKITYKAHSQSLTNYRQNGVKLRLIKSGRVIGERVDQYNSETMVGSIPGDEHHQVFYDLSLLTGQQVQLEVTVWDGDYVNFLSSLKVQSYWDSNLNGTAFKCGDFNEIRSNEFLVSNNVWGKQQCSTQSCSIPGYKECIDGKSVGGELTTGWIWIWPNPSCCPGIKAYPEIIYGWKPWVQNTISTTPKLPLKISAMNRVVVSYDMDLVATKTYNLSFDLWLNNLREKEHVNEPKPENITREIMIWLDKQQLPPDGELIGTVTISDEDYNFYKGERFDPPTNRTWTYLAFVKLSPELTGNTNIHEFINFLKNNGHITADEYLTSIEIGNEVQNGSGVLMMNGYSIQIE